MRLRRLARSLRHLPDRVLHPLRRRIVRRRLSSLARPKAILIVCNGNICRSPYAEAALSARLGTGAGSVIRISSSGFLEPGRPVPGRALEAAKARAVDLAEHRSRRLDRDAVQQADLIVVMEASQRRRVLGQLESGAKRVILLGDLDPQAIDTRAIIDPIDRSEEFFAEVYARIDRCADQLVGALPG